MPPAPDQLRFSQLMSISTRTSLNPAEIGGLTGFGIYTFWADKNVLAWSADDARKYLRDNGYEAEAALPTTFEADAYRVDIPPSLEYVAGHSGEEQEIDHQSMHETRHLIKGIIWALSRPSTFPVVEALQLGRDDLLGWSISVIVHGDELRDKDTQAYYFLRYPDLKSVFKHFRAKRNKEKVMKPEWECCNVTPINQPGSIAEQLGHFGIYSFKAHKSVLGWNEENARQTLHKCGNSQLADLHAYCDREAAEIYVPEYLAKIYGASGETEHIDLVRIDDVVELVKSILPAMISPSTFPNVPELEMTPEALVQSCLQVVYRGGPFADPDLWSYYSLRYPNLKEILQDLRITHVERDET